MRNVTQELLTTWLLTQRSLTSQVRTAIQVQKMQEASQNNVTWSTGSVDPAKSEGIGVHQKWQELKAAQ